ncbi:hypothetical protein ACFZAM_31820 [Streptomyces sp. NPDC008079]|uniref:hypothetical protein n=1 Tax=Streptomyces sp. NPDC008079 TaxID=3364806 RepID=UPI0036E25F52
MTGDAEEIVAVRFKLSDTTRMLRHAREWNFYNGTALAYFALQPILWWPEGAQAGLPMDQPQGWKVEFHGLNSPSPTPVMVTMHLPRSVLAREQHVPYAIVAVEPDDQSCIDTPRMNPDGRKR